jgi:hypothetical protein
MGEENFRWGKNVASAGREWGSRTLRNQDAEIYIFKVVGVCEGYA